MADPDLNIKAVIDALDSFYCHNVIVSLWADAVANRLEGLAIYLLSDELPEVADPVGEAGGRHARVLSDLRELVAEQVDRQAFQAVGHRIRP